MLSVGSGAAARLAANDHRGHPLQSPSKDMEGRHPMVEVTMNGLEEMRKLIKEGDVDLLRTMVKRMAEALMDAEVDALFGASHGERHLERVNRRNGYRERNWDTRTGTIELAVPKLRAGSYFSDWLLTPRKRSEQALVAAIAAARACSLRLRGVSSQSEK